MRIQSIHLQNFKRFSDLLIRDIPSSAKLVVVVGPNGCGKSSLFDALLQWYRRLARFGHKGDEPYFRKDSQESFDWNRSVEVALHEEQSPGRGSLYVRTAYRNDPDFSVSGIQRPGAPTESVRFSRMIEDDRSVSENYQRLVYETTAAVYDESNDTKAVRDLREELIGQVRASMSRVFGDLLLKDISDPLGSGAFFFEKGTSRSYHYKNLSGGEKAAFDLLLDLHLKKRYFANAVYCVDEVEAHLHTRAQGPLLRELVAIVPGDSQLWVTTHSLGVLRAAQEMDRSHPGSVCLLDFDAVDFDTPMELPPATLGRVTWEKMLSITIDDLSRRVAPGIVIVCEGSSIGNRRKDFDAEIYNRILGIHNPEVLFVSGGSSDQVARAGTSVANFFRQILPNTRIVGLVDRDDRSLQEVAELEAAGNIVLGRRNLESYLFAEDVLEALVLREGKSERLEDALNARLSAIANSTQRGHPSDDLKSAAGEIYNSLRQLLDLRRVGNNTDAFMRDTMAPLVRPGMSTYEELKRTIIDRLI